MAWSEMVSITNGLGSISFCRKSRSTQITIGLSSVLRIRILLFTLMRVRIRILPFTLMRIWIRIQPFYLIRIRIRILPLSFSRIRTLQCYKMTLSGFHLFTLMRTRILFSFGCGSESSFPLWCGCGSGSGSSFPKWCGSGCLLCQ